MDVRSDRDVWVGVNFKETQTAAIRIGHPIDLYFDTYPGRVFHGRMSGFNPGMGSSKVLFSGQNTTGNFVNIVQCLPVRIEMTGDVFCETHLFVHTRENTDKHFGPRERVATLPPERGRESKVFTESTLDRTGSGSSNGGSLK